MSKREPERIEHPVKADILINVSDLKIYFRDFCSAWKQRPSLSEAVTLLVAVIPAVTANFPDRYAGIDGKLLEGIYLGIIFVIIGLKTVGWIQFFKAEKHFGDTMLETNPDKKVEQIIKEST